MPPPVQFSEAQARNLLEDDVLQLYTRSSRENLTQRAFDRWGFVNERGKAMALMTGYLSVDLLQHL